MLFTFLVVQLRGSHPLLELGDFVDLGTLLLEMSASGV